jgi:hypothetical protein
MSFKDMFFKKDKRFEPDIEDVPLILSGSFEEKIRNITNLFENCYDFSIREFLVEKTLKGCVFFFESLISYENVNRFILKQFMHPCHEKPYSLQASIIVAVPIIFVLRNRHGFSILLSTWLSAAKFTTMSGCSSSKRLYTALRSQISALTNLNRGLSITEARVEKFPA